MFIVLIETSGNQRYIFATNKLRENVGASEVTYQIGTSVLRAAVKSVTGRQVPHDLTKEPTIETGNDTEVIIATSGKALLLVRDGMKAKEIVSYVTKHALTYAPGLTVHGAIEKAEENLSDIHKAVGNVHKKLERLRYEMPSNDQRFLRLPFVAPCATSGLPATRIYRHESLNGQLNELKPYAGVSIEKQEKSNAGRKRLENTIQSVKPEVQLVGNINELEKKFKETRWIAIIHADGNGMGEIFLGFDEYTGLKCGKCTPREYINKYRLFSLELDACTIEATGVAIENLQNSYQKENKKGNNKRVQELPFIPLILGGDDLTVICDGEYALKFTYDFLTEYEKRTSSCTTIKEIANKAFGVERLGICAGVAIVKPHYPFHQAYELAEQLLKSAKQVKTKVVQADGRQFPCSAMDFHVLYDSSAVELKGIREKLSPDPATFLYAKPYVVTSRESLGTNMSKAGGTPSNQWLDNRIWDQLRVRVNAMRASEPDDTTKRKLPNSQLHHIRESIHRGRSVADSEVNLFKHRYSAKGFDKLLCSPDSLFFEEKETKEDKEIVKYSTHFMDALDVVEFWKGF